MNGGKQIISARNLVMDYDARTRALDHLTLRAREMGLGTCWIGAFDEARMREFLGIPDEKIAVIGMTLGYPGDQPTPRERRSLDELVHWERY